MEEIIKNEKIISGYIINNLLEVVSEVNGRECLLEILRRNKISNIKKEMWYSNKQYVNVLKALHSELGTNIIQLVMFRLGEEYCNRLLTSKEGVKNHDDLVRCMNNFYHFNVHYKDNTKITDSVIVIDKERSSPTNIVLYCLCLFPQVFLESYILGIFKTFSKNPERVSIKHLNLPPSKYQEVFYISF